jgi:hypothetical protein
MSREPIQIWRPSLRAFGLRSLGIFLVTYLLLTPVWPFVGGIAAFFTAVSLCLVYMFVLDDFTHWFDHSKAKWTLTHNELIYENPEEDLAAHAMSLSEIASTHRRFFWNVQLRLSNGTAITMHYIDRPKIACQILDDAIAAQAIP